MKAHVYYPNQPSLTLTSSYDRHLFISLLLVDLPILSPMEDEGGSGGTGVGGSGSREEEEGDFLGTQTGTSMDLSHALEGKIRHWNMLYPVNMPF